MVVESHLRRGQRDGRHPGNRLSVGVGHVIRVGIGHGYRIGGQHSGLVLQAIGLDRVRGLGLQPAGHVAVVEEVLARRVGDRGPDESRTVVQPQRDAFERAFGRILQAVFVVVDPHTVADFDRRLLAQRLDVAERVRLAERRVRFREGRRVLRDLQFNPLNNVAARVVVGHDPARTDPERREGRREHLGEAGDLLEAATFAVRMEHVVVVELAVNRSRTLDAAAKAKRLKG